MHDPFLAIKLCGTEQPDVVGRILSAGPLTAEFDNGNLRYVRLHGVEMLRAIAYLVRDENWGTYTPELSNLTIDQKADGFRVSYHAVCKAAKQEMSYDATIVGAADGSLRFHATARAHTAFLTNRTGFVVLHPLKGIVGETVSVLKVDGTEVIDTFPEKVNPDCPFRDIRALSHQVLPGVWVTCRMEGETYEMEDHRNWTDASFKTYVRPLSKPWPYTLPKGEIFEQTVSLSLRGSVAAVARTGKSKAIAIAVGDSLRHGVPAIGLGLPPEELDATLKQIEVLAMIEPKFLVCRFDARAKHGVAELRKYREICERVSTKPTLEIVVQEVDGFGRELNAIADLCAQAGFAPDSVAVVPVGDLKSVLPGGKRPPAPPLEDLYAAARHAFPNAKIGGGMFSFFTELNRKRPPAALLDFVTNATCPIVHAPDDRSAMETMEALPWQIKTARSFLGQTPHRIGPSSIGCRDNPHGATFAANPDNLRVCLAQMDPRWRGIFGAAWTTAYIAALARGGAEAISIGAPTGPLGMIYRKTDYAQPYYDALKKPAVYPVFHVLSGMTRGCGQKMVEAASSDNAKVECFAYRNGEGTTLWLANLTAEEQAVSVKGIGAGATIGLLDASSFALATSDAKAFRNAGKPMADGGVKLGAYGVAFIRA